MISFAPRTAAGPSGRGPAALLRLTAALVALGWAGCKACSKDEAAAEPEVQPGADDPTARKAVRAGQWYAGTAKKLDKQIGAMMKATGAKPEGKAFAVLTPHGGVKHSGPTAAEVWSRIEAPPVVIVLAPNHFKDGERLAIWTEGPWLVPGHALAVDAGLTAKARAHMPQLVPDRAAFSHHETELQMPFLQFVRPDVRMVLITLRDNEKQHFQGTSKEEIQALGEGLAAFLRELEADGVDFTLVITTDLVHYVPVEQSDTQDTALMQRITSYDVDGLWDYVKADKVSICGEFPAAVGMTALKALGKPPMQWQTRGNNLKQSKKPEAVVGYPGGILWR